MVENCALSAQVTLLLSTVLGLTINHSTFICTRYNDPLTTSVAGSLKNIIMTLIGAVSFGDFKYAKWNVVGLGVSMAGAIWYATRAAIKARAVSRKTSHQHWRSGSSSACCMWLLGMLSTALGVLHRQGREAWRSSC